MNKFDQQKAGLQDDHDPRDSAQKQNDKPKADDKPPSVEATPPDSDVTGRIGSQGGMYVQRGIVSENLRICRRRIEFSVHTTGPLHLCENLRINGQASASEKYRAAAEARTLRRHSGAE